VTKDKELHSRRKIRPAAIMLALVLILNTFAFAADTTTVEAATVPSGETALLAVNDYPAYYTVGVRALTQQPYNQLCWAGVTSAVINYYTNSSETPVSLARIVHADYASTAEPPAVSYQDAWYNLALPLFGAVGSSVKSVLQGEGISGASEQTYQTVLPPDEDELMSSIYTDSSPIIISLVTVTGSHSHAVLSNGYANNATSGDFFLSISDPWGIDTTGSVQNYFILKNATYFKDGEEIPGGFLSCDGIRFIWGSSYFNLSSNS